MKSWVYTEELCYRSVPLEQAPGAKSLVCIDLNESLGLISDHPLLFYHAVALESSFS